MFLYFAKCRWTNSGKLSLLAKVQVVSIQHASWDTNTLDQLVVFR
jgi:hypothetical protein